MAAYNYSYDAPVSFFGVDSITETQKLELEILANACPYIEGSAVYKARTIYSVLNPLAQYNDRLMCIQGQNKNGGNGFINLDSLYEAETNIMANALAQHQGIVSESIMGYTPKSNNSHFEEILVYPNPANSYINISNHNDEGELLLYNSIGSVVLKEKLFKAATIQTIKLPTLSNGVYHYTITLSKGNYSGNLNIMQHE